MPLDINIINYQLFYKYIYIHTYIHILNNDIWMRSYYAYCSASSFSRLTIYSRELTTQACADLSHFFLMPG